MISLVAVAVFVISAVIAFVKRWRDYVALVDKVPGPKANFLFGNIRTLGAFSENTPTVPRVAVINERLHALNVLYGQNGLFRMWLGLTPTFLITKHRFAETILNSNTLLTKSGDYNLVVEWLGYGLLTSTGEKWKTRRKLLTPAFHFRILEDFLTVFNEQTKIFVDVLRGTSKKEWVNVSPYVTRFTLDIILETAMGVTLDVQRDENSVYLAHLHRLSTLFMERSPRPWLWPRIIFSLTAWGREFYESIKYLQDFTLQVIRDKKEAFKKTAAVPAAEEKSDDDDLNFGKKKKRLALLDLLISEHSKDSQFSEEDVREEVDTFMFEGHDTTAMGLSWSLYLIGLYPEVQKKIVEELESIFGEDTERNVTFEDLKNMKYIECVIKESHRLYPPVPFIGRQATEDVKLDGYHLPKGSRLWVMFVLMLRDPEVFPNPEVFNPDNFRPEVTNNRNPYAYVPFSAGPRNCIGQKFAMMEEKTTLAYLLRNFVLESLDARDKVVTKSEMVYRPVGALRMRFKERNQNA